jgi:molecular chaperone DnaK
LDLSGNVFEVLATAGDSFLGGDDLDLAVAERMSEAFLHAHRYDPRTDSQAFERLRVAGEAIKIDLSTNERTHTKLREVAFGVGGAHLDLDFGMTRDELEMLATPLVERTFAVCQEALSVAKLPVTAFDKVLLVGGSTRIPLVRRRVEQFFGTAPLDRVNADEVVAIGAAIQAAALTEVARRRSIPPPPVPALRKSIPTAPPSGDDEITIATHIPAEIAQLAKARPPDPRPTAESPAPPPVLVDVTPRALVVETVGGWCDVVVQRNAKIPCERARAFATSSDQQTAVHVRVAQGEDPVFRNNTFLGEVELVGLRPARRGEVTIQVRFEVDESGTLKVYATDVATGHEAHALLQLVGIAGAPTIEKMQARHAAAQLR